MRTLKYISKQDLREALALWLRTHDFTVKDGGRLAFYTPLGTDFDVGHATVEVDDE